MDLNNLTSEQVSEIKDQLSNVVPGTRCEIVVDESQFYIYVPEKIDENTGIQIAGRGGGGIGDCFATFDHAVDNQSNAIILAPIHGDAPNSSDPGYDWKERSFNIIDCIKDENPVIADTAVVCQGYSASFVRVMEGVSNNCDRRSYPIIPVLLEPRNIWGSTSLSDDEIAKLIETKTPVIHFDINSGISFDDVHKSAQNDLSDYAKRGLNVYTIEYAADSNNGSSHSYIQFLGADMELWRLSNGTFDLNNLPDSLNYYSHDLTMTYQIYKYDENGEKVLVTDPNKIASINEIINGTVSTQNLKSIFTPDEINDMYEKYKKDFSSYNMHMRESLDNINGMMSEFLTTDAGFLAEKIHALTSKINGTKIRNLKITADYASTTNSPKIQDVKIMEYVAKTSELLFKTLECVEFAMHAQIEIEATEDNIKDRAEDLAGGRSTTDAVLAGAIAGLGAAADALGYTGTKKQEYIDSETAKLFEKYYGEEANKEAESKGLSGKDKDKFIDDYIKGRIEEFEKNKDKYDVDVETEASETDLKGNEVKDEQEKVDEANMSSTVNKNTKYDDAKKPSEEKGNSDVKENTKLNSSNNKDRRDNSTNQSNNDSNRSNASSTVNKDKTEDGTNGSKDENKTVDSDNGNNQNNSGNTGGTGNVSNSNSNAGSNGSSSGSSSGNSGYSPSTPSAPSNPDIIDSGTLTPTNDTVEFPEYSSVVSDNDTDVYSSLDSSYKIIINHDNNSVTSVEHYFDFGNADKALTSLEKITQGYSSDVIKSIKCEGQYIKVIFKDSYFNTSSYNDFISKFEGFNKITK